MSLGCWWKTELPIEAHSGAGRTCRLHTERPQSASRLGPTTLFPVPRGLCVDVFVYDDRVRPVVYITVDLIVVAVC